MKKFPLKIQILLHQQNSERFKKKHIRHENCFLWFAPSFKNKGVQTMLDLVMEASSSTDDKDDIIAHERDDED